jgi:O-acetyl-ADP-ribose deacetylase
LSIIHFLHALAAEHGLKTIAFPSISTGAYAFPVDRAAKIALTTVRDVLAGGCPVERVTFVCFTRADLATYRKAFSNLIFD